MIYNWIHVINIIIHRFIFMHILLSNNEIQNIITYTNI